MNAGAALGAVVTGAVIAALVVWGVVALFKAVARSRERTERRP